MKSFGIQAEIGKLLKKISPKMAFLKHLSSCIALHFIGDSNTFFKIFTVHP
jgi:hypothetical protein